jgi:hypothetical protein
MKTTITVLLLVAAAALPACNGAPLMPDYEVLEVPRPEQQYKPGQKWNKDLPGPTQPAAPNVPVASNPGLANVKVGDKSGFKADLKVPVIKWIGGSLGLDSNESVGLELKSLRHAVVTDARPIHTTGAVLWETVAAESMKLTVQSETATRLDLTADVLKRLLEASPTGNEPVSVGVALTGENTYEVSSDKPLVVAVRVVKLGRDVREEQAILDLTTIAVTNNQRTRTAFGYEVELRPPVDPLTRRVQLRIRNVDVPGWTGTTHQFGMGEGEDTWVNDNREVIAARDPAARDADYVWDTMNIEWKPDLSQCVLHVIRQYVKLEAADSGLKGTR